MNVLSIYWQRFVSIKLSQLLFWVFLITLPLNTRIIFRPSTAYIEGYFSYYLGTFLYISDLALVVALSAWVVENRRNLSIFRPKLSIPYHISGLIILSLTGWEMFHVQLPFIWKLYNILKILEFGGVVFLVKQVIQSKQNLKLAGCLIYIGGIFQAILGFLQFHVQHGLGLRILGEYVAPLGTGGLAMLNTDQGQILRAYGTLPHPNILAAFLLVAITWSYFLVSHETRQINILKFQIGTFMLIIGIFLTFSRVVWFTTAIMTIIYIFYTFLKVDRKRSVTLGFVALVSCATILGLWHNLILPRISNIQQSNSYTERVAYNHLGLAIFKSTPFFGTGTGNYVPTLVSKYPELKPWEYQPPHNIFIYIAATFGLVGLLGFLVLLYTAISSTWNTPTSNLRITLLTLVFSLLFISLFDHFLVTIQQGQLLFFTSLGLLTSYKHIHNAHEQA